MCDSRPNCDALFCRQEDTRHREGINGGERGRGGGVAPCGVKQPCQHGALSKLQTREAMAYVVALTDGATELCSPALAPFWKGPRLPGLASSTSTNHVLSPGPSGDVLEALRMPDEGAWLDRIQPCISLCARTSYTDTAVSVWRVESAASYSLKLPPRQGPTAVSRRLPSRRPALFSHHE